VHLSEKYTLQDFSHPVQRLLEQQPLKEDSIQLMLNYLDVDSTAIFWPNQAESLPIAQKPGSAR